MTTADGFEQSPRPALTLVPPFDDGPGPLAAASNLQLEIEAEVADQLRRCASGAGLSVSVLLRALLAVQVPRPILHDLVRCSHSTSVFRIDRVSPDGRFFLGAAHGLHRFGSVRSASWLGAQDIRRVESTDR